MRLSLSLSLSLSPMLSQQGAGKINYAAKQMQASQEHIWSKVRPLIESAVRKSPHNACIFAYGGTGSGKTYTMGGVDKEELKAKFK